MINLNNKNIFGINVGDISITLNKNFVLNINNIRYFDSSNSESQLDYTLYLNIVTFSNYEGRFYISLSTLIENMGFKPRTGSGNINERVKQSLDRLETKHNMIKLSRNNKEIHGEIFMTSENKETFNVKISDIHSILRCSKYTDKQKVLYLYSYIIASDYKNNNLNVGILSRDCSISKDFVLKCIDKFHEDGLIDKKYISTSRTIKEEDKPYVYIHINKLNGEVLYVGKGRNERYCDLKSRNSKYTSFISEIGEDNIECKIIDYFDNDYSAYVYEYEIVSKYRAIGQAKYCIVLGNLEIKDGQ